MLTHGTPQSVNLVVRCVDPRCNRAIIQHFPDAAHFNYFGASLRINRSYLRFHEDLGSARLHLPVSKVILVDHFDCREYRRRFGTEYAANPADCHSRTLTAVVEEIRQHEPTLIVESYILDLESGQLIPCQNGLRLSA